MSKRIKKSFFVFALVSVLLFDYMELMIKDKIKLITIIISIFDHILKTYYLMTINFYYIILIHYEYLFKNLNQILENQTELIHENCEEILKKLTIIKGLFKSLNKTFGKIFTMEATNELLCIIGFVSNIKNQKNHFKI